MTECPDCGSAAYLDGVCVTNGCRPVPRAPIPIRSRRRKKKDACKTHDFAAPTAVWASGVKTTYAVCKRCGVLRYGMEE